jgi:hypothetical protein
MDDPHQALHHPIATHMSIRFAILAGVSTEAQAHADKLSIPDQIEKCRAIIASNNGIEAIGPFVMDGYSRTGYDSLDIAMLEIPPLGEAIRAAMANQYDILLMDNFDRLGDLGFIVKTRFKKLRKQIISVRQSGKIIPPDQYDPYASEDMDMAMFAQGIIQTYRINKIRRGWNIGVPKRAEDGLHPLCTAYGYQAQAKGKPAQQIPEEVEAVTMMKDLYLKGHTLIEICNQLHAAGIKPKRAPAWSRTVVKRIILNPFYAGIVIFGKLKTENKKRIAQPPSQWVRGKGQHTPLWDEQTYFAILAEQERRDGLRARAQTYALTGLLECSICGTSVHRHGKPPYIYINCRAPVSHVNLRYDAALVQVADTVVNALQNYKDNPIAINNSENFDQLIKAQQTLRQRIQQGYENGIYTQAEAQKKIVSAETEIERLLRARTRSHQQHAQKKAMLQFAEQDLNRMRHWIINDNPATVNVFLTSLCEKIIVTPESTYTVQWRS